MKPGKPVAFGQLHDALFLGLPANPVAVFVTGLVPARPLILKMQGAMTFRNAFTHVPTGFVWTAGKRQKCLPVCAWNRTKRGL